MDSNGQQMKSGLDFSVNISKHKLAELFEEAIDNALTQEPLEVNSITILLERVGQASLLPSGKNIHLVLPYKVDIRRAAGLFSMEGSGSIHLELDISYDVSKEFKIKSHTVLDKYGWFEKPQLEIGKINIPLEKLIDMVIKHYESVITGKIDSAIRENANIQAQLSVALANINHKIKDTVDTKGTHVSLNIEEVGIKPPEVDEAGDINIVGRIRPEILITDKESNYQFKPISFHWLDEYTSEHNRLEVYADISYAYIAQMIKEESRGKEIAGKPIEIGEVKIYHEENTLHIEAVMDGPIKAYVKVSAIPRYIQLTGELLLGDVHVHVHPANVIYKLTAPLVNSFIENKINTLFPMVPAEKIQGVLEKNMPKSIDIPHGKVEILHDQFEIVNLVFLDDKINALIGLKDVDVIGTIR